MSGSNVQMIHDYESLVEVVDRTTGGSRDYRTIYLVVRKIVSDMDLSRVSVLIKMFDAIDSDLGLTVAVQVFIKAAYEKISHERSSIIEAAFARRTRKELKDQYLQSEFKRINENVEAYALNGMSTSKLVVNLEKIVIGGCASFAPCWALKRLYKSKRYETYGSLNLLVDIA